MIMNVCIYEMSLQEMKETNGGGALDILINTIVDVLNGRIPVYV